MSSPEYSLPLFLTLSWICHSHILLLKPWRQLTVQPFRTKGVIGSWTKSTAALSFWVHGVILPWVTMFPGLNISSYWWPGTSEDISKKRESLQNTLISFSFLRQVINYNLSKGKVKFLFLFFSFFFTIVFYFKFTKQNIVINILPPFLPFLDPVSPLPLQNMYF